MRLSPLFAPVLLGLGALAAQAGVALELQATRHGGAQPVTEVTRILAESPRVMVEVPERDGRSGDRVIFDAAASEMTHVDASKKQYLVIDQATVRQLAGIAGQLQAMLDQALAQVPPAQREQARKMMEARMGPIAGVQDASPAITFHATGERAVKNGWPCTKHEAVQEGRVVRELWVTDWANLDGGVEARAALMGLSRFIDDVTASLPIAAAAKDPLFERLAELGGFPVVTRELGPDGGLTRELQLLSSTEQAVDPVSFVPPAGYTRREIEMPKLGGLGR